MKTLGRNADNDLYLEAGNLALVQGAEAQCAVIESILKTQKGELQFNEDQGIDYFGTVLQNPKYIDFWAGQVRTAIEDLDFVSSVEDFTYRFDRETSTLYWSMTVVNTDDERLDLRNKKTVIDGSPGVQLEWENIHDKPEGIEDTVSMVENMAHESVNYQEDLDDSNIRKTNLKRTKEILNGIIFEPNDPSYVKTRVITFTFSSVPLGSVIDFANLRVVTKTNGSAKYTVEISDGTKTSIGYSRSEGEQTVVKFGSGDDASTAHTVLAGKEISVKFRGDIIGFYTAGMTDVNGNPLPIFINGKNTTAFPYLSGITIGSRVPLSAIGNDVFRSFQNLKSIDWEDSAADNIVFGNNAFMGCSSLLDLTWLPSKVKAIGTACFKDCTALLSMRGFTHVPITELPNECFMGCKGLQSVEWLPNVVTVLGIRSFCGCKALKNIKGIPDSVEEFGEGCFSKCTGMTEILYPPESITTIGKDCFSGCTALESVFISQGLTEIGAGAFSGCTALNDVRCDATAIPSIQDDTFDADMTSTGSSPISVYVPSGMLDDYMGDQHWGKFNLFKYGVYSFLLSDIIAGTEGVRLIAGTSELQSDSIWTIQYGAGDKEQRFISSETGLPEFTYTENLDNATITIKGYIKSISGASESAYPFFATAMASAFPYLKEIKIEDSPLEFLGDHAFRKCTGLESVDLGFPTSGDGQPYHLGVRTFAECSSLKTTDWLTIGLGTLADPEESTETETVYYDAFGEGCFEDAGIESLAYNSDNVKSLPAYCFAGTAITSLADMGTLVSKLGEYCFANCESLLNIDELLRDGMSISTLPNYCFSGCTALENIDGIRKMQSVVYVPGSSGDIEDQMGNHVFEGCTGLKSIEPIAAASNITAITDYMFADCGLESLEGLTDKITSLGVGCFQGCKVLEDITALEGIGTTEIPQWCFKGNINLKTLIGCAKVTSIGEGAFSGCTGLLSTSGLGADIASIGSNAFQDCTGLLHISMIASQAPSLGSNVFEGVSKNIPLYIAPNAAGYSGNNTEWASFTSRTRTIQIRLNSITEIQAFDAGKTLVAAKLDTAVDGVWYADYGNGEGFKTYYPGRYGSAQPDTSLESYEYDLLQPNSYTITLFGDITSIGSGEDPATDSDMAGRLDYAYPFLGSLAVNASSVDVSTDYLRKIEDFCFCKYGQEDGELELTLDTAAEIGAFAFAKQDSKDGTIGTISVCGSSVVGAYAFYRSGLDSSAPFTKLTTAGRYSFALNTALPDVLGFSALTEVAPNMFDGCSSIRDTTGLTEVVTIGEKGFKDCTGITVVKDFASLGSDDDEGIRNHAFTGCIHIGKVLMAFDNPPTLVEDGFDDDTFRDATLYVPAGSVNTYGETVYWTRFDKILSRAIVFVTNSNIDGTRLKSGFGKVDASGAWTVSVDGQEVNRGQAGSDLNILKGDYTFSGSNAHEIQVSGAIIGIKCTDSQYPIFASYRGTNIWLKEVYATGEMEVTSIGDYTFAGCTNLASIKDLPSVTSIGMRAFGYNLSNSNDSKCSSLVDISGLENVQTIGDGAFAGCTALTKIDGFGMNVVSIGAQAFYGCPLKEVQMFASTPPTIAANAFDGIDKSKVPLYVLSGYENAYAADSVWSDFKNISSRHVSLTLSAPSALSIVGDKGIIKSDTYWAVNFGDGTSIEGRKQTTSTGEGYLPAHEFTYARDYTVLIEGGITELSGSLGESSFLTLEGTEDKCLTAFEATDSSPLTKIGDWTFRGETSLSTIRAKNAATIGQSAFEGCSAIPNLSGFGGVVTLKERAFWGCTGLSAIESLGPKLETISSGAFGGGINITYIQMQALLPPSLDNLAFDGSNAVQSDATQISIELTGSVSNKHWTGNLPIYVPSGSKGYYNGDMTYEGEDVSNNWKYFRHWSDAQSKWISDIMVRSLKFNFTSVPAGTTFISGTSRIASTSAWSVDWGDGTVDLMSINDSTLPQHTYATAGNYTVSLEGNITSIGAIDSGLSPMFTTTTGETKYLTSVFSSDAMPIQTIGPYCFAKCSNLQSVGGFTNVTYISEHAFFECSSLNSVGTVVSGDGFLAAEVIGDYAFAECPKLPSLVGFPMAYWIGDFAFFNDTRLFTTYGLGVNSPIARSSYSPDTSDQGRTHASFGAYSFGNCPLAEIYSYFIEPPYITGTTFSGADPSTTRVYVWPSVVEEYKTATYWSVFYRNIGVYSVITITVQGVGEGTAIIGHGYLSCVSCLIDWGDGSVQTVGSSTESETPVKFPDHTFTAGTAQITISGSISELSGALISEGTSESSVTDAWESPRELMYNPLFTANGDRAVIQGISIAGSSSLKTIGAGTFCGCGLLGTSTSIPGTVVTIGNQAFANNVQLDSIVIPSSVKELGCQAFSGCRNLQSVQWGEDTDNIETNEVASVSNYCFYNCNALATVSLYKRIGSFPIGCFENDGNLNTIIVGTSALTSIGRDCFAGSALANFYGIRGSAEDSASDVCDLSDAVNLSAIGDHAFLGCQMQTLKLPKTETFTTVGRGAFSGCSSLQILSGFGHVEELADRCFFKCSSLADINDVLSHATGTIGAYCFAGCRSLGHVVIPSTVSALGEGCFNCSSNDWLDTYESISAFEDAMTSLYGGKRMDKWGAIDAILCDKVQPDGNEYTESHTPDFRGPTDISWSYEGVATVGAGCFMNCTRLALPQSANLNDDEIASSKGLPSLAAIPSYCFYNCQNLFNGRDLSLLPSTITYFGRFALARTGMTGIGRGGESPISASLAPALFLGCTAIESLGDSSDGLKKLFSTIPSAIPDGCFYGCTELYDINTLSADAIDIKRLGQYCFANCTKLSGRGTYNISNALSEITQIDDGCFMGCAGLTQFDGLAKVSHYPYRAFYGCTSLAFISRLCSDETSMSSSGITLDGDSFGGISNIWKISLPYDSIVVETGVSSGIDEQGEGFQTSDPFSGLTIAQKGRVFVEVPADIIVDYTADSYWRQFAVTTPIGDLIPAVQMKMKVPAGGGTVYCNGGVIVVGGDQVIIDWGDGSDMIAVTQGEGDTSISISGISHEYDASLFPEDALVTLTIFGRVTSFYGKGDDSSTSVVKNKTIVPIISTTASAVVAGGTGVQAENTWLEEVSFPGSDLTSIGEGAFGNCPNLSSVREIPDTVTSIGNCAFFGCSAIENLNFLPTTLTLLGKYCFAYCTGLRNFNKFKQCSGVTEIPPGCFNSISARTKTFDTLDWLPPNVTNIGYASFQLVYFENFGITATNSNTITVDSYAFRQNLELKSLSGIKMQIIGTNVFRQCSKLTSLSSMNLVGATKIPTATFRDCTSLTSLEGLPNGITSIENGAFYNTSITSLYGLPSTVTRIGDTSTAWDASFESSIGGAFGKCERLSSLNGMPNSVTLLGTAAFKGCSALGRLTYISTGITAFGDYCFAGSGLTDLDYIPSGLSSLGKHCFEGCASMVDLSGLDLLGNLTEIPEYCFAGCTSLKYIVEGGDQYASPSEYKSLNGNVVRIQNYAFSGCVGIVLIKLGRWMPSSVDSITSLNDTSESPTVFPYSTLADRAGFKIYVPYAAASAYSAVWCSENRFGKRDEETGAWTPLSIETY